MKSASIHITAELPDLNWYIKMERSNKYAAAAMKKKATNVVAWELKSLGLPKLKCIYNIRFVWLCKNKRKDKDNVSFGKKFIFDGFVAAGILKNDGWDEICGDIVNRFIIEKTRTGVIMEFDYELEKF